MSSTHSACQPVGAQLAESGIWRKVQSRSSPIEEAIPHSSYVYHLPQSICKNEANPYRSQEATAILIQLPPELLSAIFLLAVGAPLLLPMRPDNKTFLAVTQVCSTWRAVAFATPEFWRPFMVDFDDAAELSTLSIANAFIERCTNPYLSIDISHISHRQHSYSGCVRMLLLPHSHRLKKLQVRISPNELEDIFNIPPGSFPILEKVNMSFIDVTRSEGSTNILLFKPSLVFDGCLSLREVELWSRARYNPLDLPIPWYQLTKLKLSGKFPREICLEVLNRCSYLQSCIIDILVVEDSLSAFGAIMMPARPILLPHLERLELMFFDSHFDEFLNCLMLPNITSLSLIRHSGRDSTFWVSPLFRAFLENISSTLMNFSFEDDYTKPCNLHLPAESILECVPCVRRIKFPKYYSPSDDILGKIGSGDLLPQVEELIFHTREAVPEAYRAVIKARLHYREMLGQISTRKLAVIRSIEVLKSTWTFAWAMRESRSTGEYMCKYGGHVPQ